MGLVCLDAHTVRVWLPNSRLLRPIGLVWYEPMQRIYPATVKSGCRQCAKSDAQQINDVDGGHRQRYAVAIYRLLVPVL